MVNSVLTDVDKFDGKIISNQFDLNRLEFTNFMQE